MLFFFKKSKIVLDAFTCIPHVHELFKIRKAMTYFPESVKALPSAVDSLDSERHLIPNGMTTLKRCNGLVDLYKQGFIIPLWTNVRFFPKSYSLNQCNTVVSLDKPFEAQEHPRKQYSTLYENYFHTKLLSPWVFKENTGIKWLFTPASWNIEQYNKQNDVIILNGCLDYKNNNATHVNLFVKKNVEYIELPSGMPLIHTIPLSEKQVILKQHVVSEQEWLTKSTMYAYDGGDNRLRNWLHKKREAEKLDKKEATCPFGFSKK